MKTSPLRRTWLPPAVEKLGRGRFFAREEALFHGNDPAAGVYEIESGRVRLSRTDQSGSEVILQVAGPGDLIAEASLFAQAYHCDAIAVTEAHARFYPKQALLAEFRRDPRAAEAFMARVAHELMSLRTRLELRNIRSAKNRVQAYLALNTAADGRTIALQGTVKHLAAELGLTHEALYRTLKRLEAERRITRALGKIILQKPGIV